MLRHVTRQIAWMGLLSVAGVGIADATHPIQIHQYAFVPEESVLHVSGGFPGYDLTYHLFGSFGLVVDPHPRPVPDPQSPDSVAPHFSFTNVAARLVGEPPFHGESLDALVNMSGWEGRLVDPATILFRGHDTQDAPVRVEAQLGDVALWLTGRNDPPCCDFLDFRLDALAQIVSIINLDADFNGDGAVDGEDFIIWQAGFGIAAGAAHEEGDANGDGAVNGRDFLIWQGQFHPGGGDDGGAATAIPEPASLFAMLAVTVACIARRRG